LVTRIRRRDGSIDAYVIDGNEFAVVEGRKLKVAHDPRREQGGN
jgi:hypothetical protein